MAAAGLPESQESQLLAFLRDKDEPALAEALAGVASPWREALAALPRLYGGAEVIERAAAVLPALPAIEEALSRLRYVLQQAPELPFSIDPGRSARLSLPQRHCFRCLLPQLSCGHRPGRTLRRCWRGVRSGTSGNRLFSRFA